MRKKNNSIKRKIFLTTIFILLIQQIIFFISLNQSHTIQRLADNSYLDFSNNVKENSIYLESQMKKYWGDITNNKDTIQSDINNILQTNNVSWDKAKENNEIINNILDKVCPEMIFLLKRNHISGSFLILNTQQPDSNIIDQKGIYIKDISPDTNINNNADLLLCIGNTNLAKDNNLVMSPSFSQSFYFSANDNNYKELFENLYKFTLNNMDSTNKSYWGYNVSIDNSKSKSIIYSVPIADSHNKILGVLGIEISEKYLIDFMEKYDSSNKFEILLLAHKTNNGLETVSILENKRDLNIQNLNLDKEVSSNIYKINNPILSDSYACTHYLNINTQFQNNTWALVGINSKSILFSDVNQIIKYLIYSFIFSLLIAIIVCYISGKHITDPISNLLVKVRNSSAEGPIKLDKINISEIDELSSEIMNLSSQAFNNASKLSQILQMVNVPIGAFEYVFGDDTVFCTNGFFINLGIEGFKDTKNISVSVFKEFLNKLMTHLDTENSTDDNIYKIECDGKIKYLQLTLKSDKYKVLGVLSDETHPILERKKIEYERDYDLLTNLLNRMSFRKAVENILRNIKFDCGAVITINLDNLKSINNDFSYEFGDEYIKIAAKTLSNYITEKTLICRRSADEFIVFTYEYNNKEDLLNLIHDMHVALKNTRINTPDGSNRKIRSTFGISWYPDDSKEYHELCRYSEFTTFRLKKTAKGTIGQFNQNEYDKVYFLLNRNEELNKLIEEELLEYAFHPIVDIHTGKIFAYEALMRSKLESIKSPLEILQLATSESKLYEIERLTIFKSLEFYHKHRKNFNDAKLFINSIPNYILSPEDSELLESKYSEELNNVVIELLEHEHSENSLTEKKLSKIHKWNAKLAIDDFGSGYNNESVLLSITPDFVKIDMEIVQGVERDKNREHIIKNLISYAKNRNIKVIAEGIETKEQLQKLINLGVDYGQGFYFSKPQFYPPKLSNELINEIIEMNK